MVDVNQLDNYDHNREPDRDEYDDTFDLIDHEHKYDRESAHEYLNDIEENLNLTADLIIPIEQYEHEQQPYRCEEDHIIIKCTADQGQPNNGQWRKYTI